MTENKIKIKDNGIKEDEFYLAIKLEEVHFEEFEYPLLGVIFIDDLEEIPETMKRFNIENFDDENSLEDYGYTLGRVGNKKEGKWVVHEIGLSFEYVLDLFYKENFYDIRITNKEQQYGELIFSKVYLSEDNFEEELMYYRDLYKKTQKAPYGETNFLN